MCPYLPALVCFAVKNEAAPFERRVAGREDIRVLVTGMGVRNACSSLECALAEHYPSPALVITAGFAGGLNPALKTGELVCTGTPPTEVSQALANRGVKAGSFHLANRVAVTVEEKARLWQETGADVVEMESMAIAAACAKRKIPCLVLRVVLDEATDTLPLDFNQLMTPNLAIDPVRLGLAIARAPWKLPALLRLQRQSAAAAQILAGGIGQVLEL